MAYFKRKVLDRFGQACIIGWNIVRVIWVLLPLIILELQRLGKDDYHEGHDGHEENFAAEVTEGSEKNFLF